MTKEQAEKLTEWMGRSPYAVANGIEAVDVTEGGSVVRMTLRPEHKNIWGIPHGAMVFAIADTACGVAADSVHPDAHVVTAGSNLNFLYASPEAESLRAVGRVIRSGRTLVIVQTDVWDDQEHHLATGQFPMHVAGV